MRSTLTLRKMTGSKNNIRELCPEQRTVGAAETMILFRTLKPLVEIANKDDLYHPQRMRDFFL